MRYEATRRVHPKKVLKLCSGSLSVEATRVSSSWHGVNIKHCSLDLGGTGQERVALVGT